jgi:leader peptidase (prepilin peptidase)/N-methyltransferase
MLTPVIALGGLLIGSFLNVVAHRLPRGESLAHPPSRCPGCGAGVRPYDNVPVLSWLLLRGACRDCRAPISARYPLVEAATALLFALVALVHGLSPQTALGLVLVALLVPITLIDLDERIIPNRLTGPGALAAIGLLAALEPGALPEHLAAGAGAALFFGLAAVARPGGMGMGDVKLAGMLGLFLGASVAFALLVALVAGTVVGVAIMARVGAAAGRKTAVPFGPFLALGGVVALLAGAPVLDAYLSTF